MKAKIKTPLQVLALSALAALPAGAQAPAPQGITVTVAPGARQTFAGLGASIGNWGRDYQKLSAQEKARLSQTLWRDLKMKTLRLWQNLDEYEPRVGERTIADFRARYIDSGLIADARAQGVTHILLAPDAMPARMKQKREGGGADFALKDESIAAYGALIADFIKQVLDETGVAITATGLQNEPNDLDRISPEQMPRAITALRSALDARGLQKVQLIAPEAANVDGLFYDTMGRVKADAAAWNALEGIASHSYGMAATEEAAKLVAGEGGQNVKSYWQTEASANGAEEAGDAIQGASLAARFLSDMNHRVTHWVHFLGFEVPDPKDNATRIIAYRPAPLQMTLFQKYFYYRQLASTFDIGAAFRQSRSSLEGEMTWTYGPKPRVVVAAARNPDGSWGVGLANFTAPIFQDVPRERNENDFFNGYKAQAFAVTLEVPELAGSGAVQLAVRRTNSIAQDTEEAPITMKDGRATVTLGPLDLVTLRSPATRPASTSAPRLPGRLHDGDTLAPRPKAPGDAP